MKKVFCVLAVCLGITFGNTSLQAAEIPEDFKFQGKPIGAACLDFIADSSAYKPRDLNKCSSYAPAQQGDTITHFGPDFIGYEEAEKGLFGRPAYAYYQYLGKIGTLHIIRSEVSGGGAGQFSGVYGVERTGDVIQLKQEWRGGDRCNGSLSHASVENGLVQVAAYVTPADLPALVPYESLPDNLRDNLSSCATHCCIATAHFDEDILKGITLFGGIGENGEGSVDDCLEKHLVNHAHDNGHGYLDMTPEDLRQAIENFAEDCAESETSD